MKNQLYCIIFSYPKTTHLVLYVDSLLQQRTRAFSIKMLYPGAQVLLKEKKEKGQSSFLSCPLGILVVRGVPLPLLCSKTGPVLILFYACRES